MTADLNEIDHLTVAGHDRDCVQAILAQARHRRDPLDDTQVRHLLQIGYRAGKQAGRPQVGVSPAHCFGRPHMNGVSTESIADSHWLDDDPEGDYGLTRHGLLVALWFEATQGQRRFQRRWKAWGAQASQVLWSPATVDGLPLPPTVKQQPPTV